MQNPAINSNHLINEYNKNLRDLEDKRLNQYNSFFPVPSRPLNNYVDRTIVNSRSEKIGTVQNEYLHNYSMTQLADFGDSDYMRFDMSARNSIHTKKADVGRYNLDRNFDNNIFKASQLQHNYNITVPENTRRDHFELYDKYRPMTPNYSTDANNYSIESNPILNQIDTRIQNKNNSNILNREQMSGIAFNKRLEDDRKTKVIT